MNIYRNHLSYHHRASLYEIITTYQTSNCGAPKKDSYLGCLRGPNYPVKDSS